MRRGNLLARVTSPPSLSQPATATATASAACRDPQRADRHHRDAPLGDVHDHPRCTTRPAPGGTSAEELIEAADDNPEGFWESKAIRDCNDELLEAPAAWDNRRTCRRPVWTIRVRTWPTRPRLPATLRQHDHWGFKDPRTCLTAAYWLDLEPELRFVVCVRHPIESRCRSGAATRTRTRWASRCGSATTPPCSTRFRPSGASSATTTRSSSTRRPRWHGCVPSPGSSRPRRRSAATCGTTRPASTSATPGERRRAGALRAELCREAGAPPPRLAARRGQVRRLVLDGAAAQRHADQRQAAIERLQEREEEFRRSRQGRAGVPGSGA